MPTRPPKLDAAPHFSAPLNEEGSHVREREKPVPPKAPESTPALSRDERLAQKLAEATTLLAAMAPRDPRGRLLHIAVLRRDETLLDGILAELTSRSR